MFIAPAAEKWPVFENLNTANMERQRIEHSYNVTAICILLFLGVIFLTKILEN